MEDKEIKEEEGKNFYKFVIFILVNKSPIKKRKSIKDEITLIKNLKPKTEEEELSTHVIAETMKNTLYNKVIGKIEDEEK